MINYIHRQAKSYGITIYKVNVNTYYGVVTKEKTKSYLGKEFVFFVLLKKKIRIKIGVILVGFKIC